MRHNDRRRNTSSDGHRRTPPQNASDRPTEYATDTSSGPVVRAALVDGEARREAKRWNKVKTSQLRRFFGAAIADLNRMASDADAKLAMALLKAKAHYAAARDMENNKVLADFFEHHAGIVSSRDDFSNFMKHFEAVVAYHRFILEQKKSHHGR